MVDEDLRAAFDGEVLLRAGVDPDDPHPIRFRGELGREMA
jgi:hypothetical protein